MTLEDLVTKLARIQVLYLLELQALLTADEIIELAALRADDTST